MIGAGHTKDRKKKEILVAQLLEILFHVRDDQSNFLLEVYFYV